MITIKIGDCVDRLKDLDDNSVDAIISDPPYGLKFMSKGWDDIGEGSQQREWHRKWLTEAHRVLKPNGVLKAFSGSRTFHHLIAMMGEVGFSDLRIEAWTYGCLCEDTEILTDKGWLKYQELDVGSMVVAYSLEGDHFDLQEVQEMLRYEYKDTAYRIYSDDTDQLVSKNHRCIVEREGERAFHLAEHLQAKEVIPFVEDLSVQGLQQTFSNRYDCSWQEKVDLYADAKAQREATTDESMQGLRSRVSDKKRLTGTMQSSVCVSSENHQSVSGLRGGVSSTRWESGTFKGVLQERVSEESCDSKLPCLQQDIQKTSEPRQEGSSQLLLSKVQRRGEGTRVEISRTQGESGLERGDRKEILRVNEGAKQPIMEGWCDISQSKGQIRKPKDQVCSLSFRVSRDGEERWLCDGTQIKGRYANGQTTYSDRVRPPHQSRCYRQSDRELNAIQEQSRSQALRGTWSTSTTLATITPQFYEGVMWCVRVPYGAFVARRNGKVFVTGNSGFPKSHNVALGIDKKKGHANRGKAIPTASRYQASDTEQKNKLTSNPVDPYTSKTDEAKQWEGWGTALKPAWEPVCIGVKK
jgi:hypothetical protein